MGAPLLRQLRLVFGVGVALSISCASASADSLPTLFAGSWSTTYPGDPSSVTGTLNLQTTGAATGMSEIARLGGPASGCSAPTVYYTGSYTTSDGDNGQVGGCTTDLSGVALTAYYGGGTYGRHGNFSVSTSCGDTNSFSGTYDELSNNTTGNYVGARTAGSQSCASGGGGGATGGGAPGAGGAPLTVVTTTAATFDTPVTNSAPPGGAAAVQSPSLGNASAVSVTVGGLSPLDRAALAVQHRCYLGFARLLALNAQQLATFRNNFDAAELQARSEASVAQAYVKLVDCLAFADALRDLFSVVSAHGAQASTACPADAVRLRLQRRAGQTHLRSFSIGGGNQGVRVICTTGEVGLTVQVRARSPGKPLRKFVGPRLRLGVARSTIDPPGSQLSFSFHKG